MRVWKSFLDQLTSVDLLWVVVLGRRLALPGYPYGITNKAAFGMQYIWRLYSQKQTQHRKTV